MKITITAIAAIFSLFMLTVPGAANAATLNWQPLAVQQGGYQTVGWFRGRPAACRNHYFRRHHPRECR
jgi:hypothetical protein